MAKRARTTRDGFCPICDKPSSAAKKPFCSERCRLRDLAHWIGADEPYVIAGEPMAPIGHDLSDEERALLEEAAAEGGLSLSDNVIRADFRRRRTIDDSDSDD